MNRDLAFVLPAALVVACNSEHGEYGAAPSSPPPAPAATSCGPTPRPAIGPAFLESEARAVADALASDHVCEVESKARTRDPDVRLRLADYRVVVQRAGAADELRFQFSYRFARSDAGFALWAGAGMHFDVWVYRRDHRATLFSGR